MNTDSGDSSTPDDHGLNMDSAPTDNDNPRDNMDLMIVPTDDPSIQTSSSSQQTPSSVTSGYIRCVNCNLNVTRMRRHPLEIAVVRYTIQRWVGPTQEVSSGSLVCHACWTNAWNEIRQPTSQRSTEPIVGHTLVCISCGTSLLRQRSHSLTIDTPHCEQIRNMIAVQIAPRGLPRSAYLCHNCWRRTKRAVTRLSSGRESVLPSLSSSDPASSDVQAEEPINPSTSHGLQLPNYIRAPITQRHCFYPGCNESERLLVPSTLRASLLCDYNYYVPADCRICSSHLRSNSWDLLLDSIYNPIRTFNAEQMEELISLLKENMLMHLDFENIIIMPDHIVHYYLGFYKEQFQQILSEVPRLLNRHRGPLALAAYLLKLRTGDSNERISSLLQIPRSTLEGLMNMAREILHQDFVPRHLGLNNITRSGIGQRNLLIPNSLFGGPERTPIIIADGTYIYIEKSSNYLYQKKTYSLHKYRNLVKPFLLVCTDGYIIDILGPYAATTSDADIIKQEFGNENSPYRQFFEPGDVFILDRGFRDSLPLLRSCGYNVHIPLSPEDGESQLSTREANQSRAVTLCRWVVEVINGVFKTKFKIFKQHFFNRASKHLMTDFSVAAALINKFHTKLRDRDDANQIIEIVNRNMNRNNDLSDHVREHNLNRARADFQNISVDRENMRDFPRFTYSQLILIACGIYQLKQARSYYGEHIRFNGSYHIEVSRDSRNRSIEELIFGSNCYLIRARIASRHISRKVYFIYILINNEETGRDAIQQYCCNCIVGRRTVGCCAHVMTVLWYLGWARHQSNIFPPAQFLDDVLIVYDSDDDDTLNE